MVHITIGIGNYEGGCRKPQKQTAAKHLFVRTYYKLALSRSFVRVNSGIEPLAAQFPVGYYRLRDNGD